MAISTPIKITFYDPETNEPTQEFTQMFIPWRMFKSAIRLSKRLRDLDLDDLSSLPEDVYDELTAFVCEVFGNRFTIEELGSFTEFSEMIPVINQIIAMAGVLGNPRRPGKQAPRGKSRAIGS